MDIKELLGKNADDLDKLTSTELTEYFMPYMQYIKPVTENEKGESSRARSNAGKFDAGREAQRTLQMAQELMKKFNIPQQ